MKCPRCHHQVVQGVLFCPHCEAPLKIFLEEANPLGTTIWECGRGHDVETEVGSSAEQSAGSNIAHDADTDPTGLPIRRRP